MRSGVGSTNGPPLSRAAPEGAPATAGTVGPGAAFDDLFAPARTVGLATLASRVLGLVRDMACASFFGAGVLWDAFVLAWTIPNLFRRFFGEGALQSALVPTFVETLERRGPGAAHRLANSVLGLCLVLLAGLTALAMALAWVLARTVLPVGEVAATLAFVGKLEATEATLALVGRLLPYLPLVCMATVLSALLQARDRFLVPALAPAVLNLAWIAGLVASPLWGRSPAACMSGVVAGILAGGVLQCLMHLRPLAGVGFRVAPTLGWGGPEMARIGRLLAPSLLGLAALQLNLLADRFIAMAFVSGEGAVSALYYGNRFLQLPLALIGVSVAVTSFTRFSRLAAQGEARALRESVDRALRGTLFLALPASAGLAVLAGPTIAVLLERGRFDAEDTRRTAVVLALYAGSVWAVCAQQVLARALQALGDTSTPARWAMRCVALNLALNLALVFPFAEAGLAAATSIAAVVQLAGLVLEVRRRLPGALGLDTLVAALASTLASGLMAAACPATLACLDGSPRWVALAAALAAGLAAYLGLARALGLRELADVLGHAGRRPPAGGGEEDPRAGPG